LETFTEGAPSTRLKLYGLLSIQIIWAGSYILSKVLLGFFPPLIWACIKCTLAAIILVAIAIFTRRPHPKPNFSFFIPLCFCALLGGVLTQAFFLIGLKYTSSTNSGILNTLTPLITLLTVISVGWEKPTVSRTVGTMISLVGVLILCHVEEFKSQSSTFFGDCVTILGSVVYGIFLAVSGSFFQKHDRIWITAWMFIISSLCFLFLTTSERLQFHMPQITFGIACAAIYSIVFSTILGSFLVVWVVTHVPASKVSLFEYMQPVLTSFLAWFFLNERLGPRSWIGAFLIFAGVGLSTLWSSDD